MSSPKFGASLGLFDSPLDGMKKLQKYNFDFFEICIQEPYGTPEKLVEKQKEILEFTRNNNVFLLGHPPHWVN